jgi:YggT family protein
MPFIVVIKVVFTVYTLMLLIRVLGSWIPQIQGSSFFRFIGRFTDPYLNFFRKFIPPIGGVLDLSPLLAFLALQLAEILLIKIIL